MDISLPSLLLVAEFPPPTHIFGEIEVSVGDYLLLSGKYQQILTWVSELIRAYSPESFKNSLEIGHLKVPDAAATYNYQSTVDEVCELAHLVNVLST